MVENDDDSGLFAGCRIAFVPSRELSLSEISEISRIVVKHGGEVLEPQSNGKIAVHEATHIVSNTADFEDYRDADTFMVPVVVADWITNSLTRNKLAALRPHSPDPNLIFHSVNVTCADLPPSDKESIIGATLAMGGMESKDLSRLTTHICALTEDHPKVVAARAKNLKCKVVLPHWFDDCFKLGKKIGEGPYCLPDPEILKTDTEARAVDIPSSQHLEGACSAMPLTEDTRARPSLIVFNHKKIKLSDELPLSERFAAVIRGHIVKGGGILTEDVEECDMYICHYREGSDYIRACHRRIDVGNLSWLLYLITHDEWTSPMRRLLHYPIPRNGIPGFKGLRITVSNYGGEARTYLENLIRACGADFTKTMKQDNTHLITARNTSEKCEAALDWNVTMVNHLWIEESYAKCEMQHPSNNPKYTTFPARTNLSEVIGQTQLHIPTLREMYYPGGAEPEPGAESDTASEAECVEKPEEAPKQAAPKGRKAKANQAKDSPLPKAASKATFATPARASRHVEVGKENETPSSARPSSTRSAKSTALNKLHGLAPDMALYEKEKKRSSNGPWGGKRAASEIERQQAAAAGAAEKGKETRHANGEEEAERPAKRQRPSQPPVQYRICITAWKRWLATDGKTAHHEDKERRKLRQMGISIVAEGTACDYLAAPRVVRTQKFLTTLARGPDIITDQFLIDALETGELPDIEKYAMVDADYPDIHKSVARARQNKGKLLRGVPIYCTAEVPHGHGAFKAIAEANGAIFKVYRARSGSTIRPTTAEEDGGAPPDPVYLISGVTPAEKQLWTRFEEMAKQGHMEPRIVDPDWILDVAMHQRLDFDEKYLARNKK